MQEQLLPRIVTFLLLRVIHTVASAIEGTLEAAALMDIDITSANVAILGATGSIGKVAARISQRCKHLTYWREVR